MARREGQDYKILGTVEFWGSSGQSILSSLKTERTREPENEKKRSNLRSEHRGIRRAIRGIRDRRRLIHRYTLFGDFGIKRGLSLRYPHERDQTIGELAKTRGFSGSARHMGPPPLIHNIDLAQYFVGIPQGLPPITSCNYNCLRS